MTARAANIVLHLLVADGKLQAGVGPALGKPEIVITFRPDDLPTYRALIQAAKSGSRLPPGRVYRCLS